VAEDLRTHEGNFFAQGFWALFWQRFGNWRMSIRWKVLRAPMTLIYRTMYKVTQWTCGIDLPFSVIVGRRVKLEHFGGMILIAERIGDDVIIRHNTTFGIARLDHPKDRPLIGDGVEVGVGAVIVGRIIVGHGAIVGANSLVIRDVPPGVVVGGVPARILHRDVAEVRGKSIIHG
jgi:serine O-acetyltransferase